MRIERATETDWAAVTGLQPPTFWSGIVAKSDVFVYGIGAMYRAADGRWWLMFVRSPGVGMVKTAHSCAKRLIEEARQEHRDLHTLADTRIAGAEKWLVRLGFKQTAELKEGCPVWVLNFSH